MKGSSGLTPYLRQHWVRLAAALTVIGVLAAVVVLSGGNETHTASSGGDEVRVLSGGAHTVHHTIAPLPTAESPRGDALPTLIWFSATWCTNCAHMETFATAVIKSFSGQMAFVEKSVDHDRSATDRYAVRGTPTFVLIDANGEEVSRFHYAGDADAFRKAIEQALGKL